LRLFYNKYEDLINITRLFEDIPEKWKLLFRNVGLLFEDFSREIEAFLK
jgi:hypothetical protein